MKRHVLLLPLIAIFFVTLPFQRAFADVELTKGGQHLLTYREDVERVSIGNPETADINVVSSKEVLITGKSPGSTKIIVWTANGEKWTGDIVVRIDLRALRDTVRSSDAFREVALTSIGDKLRLSGMVSSLEDHQRLIALVHTVAGASNVIDDTRIASEQLVSVAVKFAAVSTSTLKRLGFDFSYLSQGFQLAVAGPNSIQGYHTGTNGLNFGERVPPIADAFNLFLSLPNADLTAVLGALSSNQMAQILAEPNLTVRSGKTAEFLVGGDLPIPVPQGNDTVGIEFRTFGIRLNLGAKVLSNDRIVLDLNPEVSEPDFTRGVSIGGVQVPSISRRAAQTTVELGNGQSLVLAGLISQSSSNADSGIPGLSRIPLFGHFFGRKSEDRQRQELVIIATPRLVAPMDTTNLPPLPGESTKDYRRSEQDLLLGRKPVRDVMIEHGLLP